MMRFIDSILNTITMYRLVFYELLFLLAAASILGIFHLVPYGPLNIAYSTAIIFAVTWIVNKVFAYFYDAPSNPESTYITALILALIISPPMSFGDPQFFILAGWASAWAIASKYIFAIKEKHLFNPVAFGVAIVCLFLKQGASWWVGTLWMLPFVAVGGFLVARKIQRFDLVIAFGISLVGTILLLSSGEGSGALHIVQQSLLYAPAVFFGTVMLTEPLTAPQARYWRIMYAVLAGFLFAPEVHIGSLYLTPELALLAANVFAYVVSPKQKLMLVLKDRIQLATDTYEFIFTSDRKLSFKAGQYLEWTLAHTNADSRGIRRYLTIASSPTESDIRIGVKFYPKMSTFKKRLLALKKGETIVASQRAGDFVLPENRKQKLVFIAGGIGITPFRSMIQYLMDTKQRRDAVLVYVNRSVEDTAYIDLLDNAERDIGLTTLPIFNTPPVHAVPGEFPTTLDSVTIQKEIPDYLERVFYLSGPRGMVTAFSDLLAEIGVPKKHIKKDFFPGFA
jgi:ferredoxin-NADP reductase